MACYTGLAGHTLSTQVVNKMRYFSSPEFNTAVAGETLFQLMDLNNYLTVSNMKQLGQSALA